MGSLLQQQGPHKRQLQDLPNYTNPHRQQRRSGFAKIQHQVGRRKNGRRSDFGGQELLSTRYTC